MRKKFSIVSFQLQALLIHTNNCPKYSVDYIFKSDENAYAQLRYVDCNINTILI